jgi:hypothetical protein
MSTYTLTTLPAEANLPEGQFSLERQILKTEYSLI